MKTSVAELISVIINRLEEQPESPPSETGLRTWLLREGYNKRDIEAAMKLVRPRMAAPTTLAPRHPGAIRLLTSFESFKLTPDARNALARLDAFELVDPFERELLLERVQQFEGEVGLDELDYLLSWMLYSTRDVESQQVIYNVFEGNRDSVN